jgi:hypothetical protein
VKSWTILIWISQVAALIAIMMADPRHGEGEAILIAAFGNKVEIIVRAEIRFCAPGIGGIRVENVSNFVFVENAVEI